MSPSNGDICTIITEESSSEMSNHPPEVTQLPGIPPKPALHGCLLLSPQLELIRHNNCVAGPQRDEKQRFALNEGAKGRENKETISYLRTLEHGLKWGKADTPAILGHRG